MSRPDVLVLGGGIVGLACARELAGRGLRVELLDRAEPGAASPAAAGMLAPLAEVPEAGAPQPGAPQPGAPQPGAPQPGPFFAACRAARDAWPAWAGELAAEAGEAVEHDASGALFVDAELGAGDRLARLAAAAAALGEAAEEVTRPRLGELVPDLAPGIGRALLLPGEHRVDNRAACRALRAAAARRGVTLTAGVAARRIERRGDGVRVEGVDGAGGVFDRDAAAAIVALGAWTGRLAGPPPLPVRPVRGQMLRLAGVAWPWRGTLRGESLYAVRRGADGLLVGATVEEAGFDVATTPAGLGRLVDFVRAVLPGAGGRPVVEAWAGLRPGTADGLPLLGPWPEPPLWVATGHYRNGVLLAPWTARHLADAVVAGASPAALAPFSPSRGAPR